MRKKSSKPNVSKTETTIRSSKATLAANSRDLTQAEKFAKAAREHGTDQDEEAFKGVLRKLGKQKS